MSLPLIIRLRWDNTCGLTRRKIESVCIQKTRMSRRLVNGCARWWWRTGSWNNNAPCSISLPLHWGWLVEVSVPGVGSRRHIVMRGPERLVETFWKMPRALRRLAHLVLLCPLSKCVQVTDSNEIYYFIIYLCILYEITFSLLRTSKQKA